MMILRMTKSVPFWLGVILFGASTVVALSSLSKPNVLFKIGIALLLLGFYCLLQYFNQKSLSKDEARTKSDTRLKCVNALAHLQPGQNLRSNIFRFNKKKHVYYIWQHHNMESDDDKTVELPDGQGCTGIAWESGTQQWGDEGDILKVGMHRIPDPQAEKIRHDLRWICSTPIKDCRSRIIAVLNFDGNMPMDDDKKIVVKQHASRVADELGSILCYL